MTLLLYSDICMYFLILLLIMCLIMVKSCFYLDTPENALKNDMSVDQSNDWRADIEEKLVVIFISGAFGSETVQISNRPERNNRVWW